MNSNPDPSELTPDDPGAADWPPSCDFAESTGETTTYSYSYWAPEEPTRFSFTHEQAKGLFVLTTTEGKVERFRDKPTRFLVVDPDPETGEIRPAVKYGEPVYLYLCPRKDEG
jgi:hypothetical protein